MRLLWPMMILLLTGLEAAAQEFRDIKAGIDGVGTGFGSGKATVSFGDFDGDGDLDVLISGMGQIPYSPVLKVYRNDNGRYSLFNDFAGLKDSLTSTAAWADLDKDGRVDLITWVRAGGIGLDGQYHETGFARIYSYRASSGAFEPAALTLPLQGVMTGARFSFADINKDQYPDLLVSGSFRPDNATRDTVITSVFRNDAGQSLTEITGAIAPITHAVAAWKDIDKDGDLDLFLAGYDESSGSNAKVYKFDGSKFVLYSTISAGMTVESADWGDYDVDGRPDLVMCGSGPNTKFFWNSGSGFLEDPGATDYDLNASDGSVAFGDVDGDGDPDLVVMGENTAFNPSHFTQILQNNGGTFIDLGTKLPPYWYGQAQFADFDKDGNLDLALCGTSLDDLGRTLVTTALYRNIRGDFRILPAQIDSISGKRPRWGDFDGDHDLDLFVCGAGSSANAALKNGVCRMYRNDAGTFVRQATPMDGLNGEPELADFDGDGRLDILLAVGGEKGLRLFRNTGSGFQETPLQIAGTEPKRIQHARVGDFDGDGDADLAVWGMYSAPSPSYFQCYSGLLRNDGGGTYSETDKGTLPSLCDGEMEWGDFDRDGDPDILFSGDTAYSGNNVSYTGVYRNDTGAFAQTADRFPGLSGAQVRWGDFDKDGDLDFAIAGSSFQTGVLGISGQNVPTTIVYRLVGGRFEEFFRPDYEAIADVAWIDFDNDGDLDLIVSGRSFKGLPPNVDLTVLYRNNGLTFTTLIPESFYLRGGVDVGDFDNDGDQDFVVSGSWMYPHTAGDGTPLVRIYRNALTAPNLVPTAPTALRSTLGPGSVALDWGAALDAETPAEAMSYNLRMGTSPGAGDVVASASLSPDGYRLMPVTGNANHIQSAGVKGLAPGTYYWSVQAVDQQMGGSPFASEQSFTLGLPAPVLLSAEPGPGPGSVTLRWNRVTQSNFGKYYLHYGTAADPTVRLDSLMKAGDTVFTITGLEDGKTYHFRLSAADVGGNASGYSAERTAVPDGTPPAVPDPVTAVPGDRAVELTWKENTESDFLCYLVYQRNASGPIQKIDSIPDIHAVTKRITGLKNGTPYSFLVVAVDRVKNHSGFSAEAVAIPSYLLTPSNPAVAFGSIHIGSGKDADLRISNASDLPVAVDSVRFVNAAFGLAGSLVSLPAKAETTLTLRFLPGKPAGGDFAGALKLYYGGAKVPLEIDLSGRATALPYCRIDKIAPDAIAWDTAATLSFLSSANDSDNAGEGDRITAYLWSSSLVGGFGDNASGFLMRPSRLGIGKHVISLRVVDNEGDTSLAATAELDIKSRKPLVRLDSISPKGLIIRGADAPRFRCTAYDLDEGADASHDSLSSFALFSTLQGRIATTKDASLDPAALSLGLHGFYAVAVDDEGDSAVSDTTWVPVQTGIGMALVVAGTDFNDNRYFYENIAPNCNWVYTKLRQRGFTDSLITYFNPVGWQSIGGAYHENSNIVDETEMTSAKLRERILAYGPRVRNGVPLVLSFIGHGTRTEQNGKFYLSPKEFVTADTLNAWLDSFNRDAEGHVTGTLTTPIVLVLDFCYSGTFLSKLRSSSQNRILISSSSADRQAYFQNGQSFSYAFFRQIGKGGNLAQAWAAGKAWSDANTAIGQDRANPLADADNDNLPNESEDLALMTQIYIGGSQQDQSPDVHWKDVRLDYQPESQSMAIRAVPEGAAPVDTAWFTLLAPDFDYASGAADPFASLPLVRQPDGSFAGSVKLEPVLSGDYLAIVYGLSGGEELMPAAKRCQTLTTLVRRLGTPLRFDLGQNFPNPGLRHTFVPFALTKRSKVSLTIMDMRGRVVRTLADGVMTPGYYTLQWDGRDAQGRLMPSGMYTYSLVSGEGLRRRKLIWGG